MSNCDDSAVRYTLGQVSLKYTIVFVATIRLAHKQRCLIPYDFLNHKNAATSRSGANHGHVAGCAT